MHAQLNEAKDSTECLVKIGFFFFSVFPACFVIYCKFYFPLCSRPRQVSRLD